MRGLGRGLGFALAVACLAAGWAGQTQAAGFDGSWSVLVATEKGTCDRAYRYGVRVADCRFKYDGEASVAMDGTVAPNGAVWVNIRLGGKSGDCAGRWEAERR